MFRLESYVAPLLVGYLNRYINVKAEDLQLRLWGGDAVLNNLELRHDVLHSCIPIPVTIQSARILQLRVHVPWTKLQSESITVTVSTVECILRANYDYKSNLQSRAAAEARVQRNEPVRVAEESQPIPTYFQAYVSRILNNIQLVVQNLIVKFIDSDFALSVNVKSLECFSTNSEWQHAFTDVCGPEWVARKALIVTDLTVCLDQLNVHGRIDAFQPPIIYRCNLQCRLFFNYYSAAMAASQNAKSASPTNNRSTTLLTLTATPKLSRVSCSAQSLNLSFTDRQLAAALRLTQRALELYARDDDVASSYSATPMMTPNSSGGAYDLQLAANRPEMLPVSNAAHKQSSARRKTQQGWLSWALGYVLPLDDAAANAGGSASAYSSVADSVEQDETALFEVEVLIHAVKLALKVAQSSAAGVGRQSASASAERETPAETDNEEPVQSGNVTPQVGVGRVSTVQLQSQSGLSASSSTSSLTLAQNLRSIEQRVAAMHAELSRNTSGSTSTHARHASSSSGSRITIGATYPIEAIGVSLVDEVSEPASETSSVSASATAASLPQPVPSVLPPSRSKYGGIRYRNVAELHVTRCQMTTRLHFGRQPPLTDAETQEAEESNVPTPRHNRNRLMSLGVGGLPPAQLAGRGGLIVTRVGLGSGYEFDLSLDDVQFVIGVPTSCETQRGRQMALVSSAVYMHRSCDQNDSVTLGLSVGSCTLRLLGVAAEPLYLLTPFAVSYKEKRSPFTVVLPLQLQSSTPTARGRRDYCSLRCDPLHAYCSALAAPSVLACLVVVCDFADSMQRTYTAAGTTAPFTSPPLFSSWPRVVSFEDDLRLGMFEWRTEPVLDGPLHHDVDLLGQSDNHDSYHSQEQRNGDIFDNSHHHSRTNGLTTSDSLPVAGTAATHSERTRRAFADEAGMWQPEEAQADAEARDGGVSRIDWDRVFPSSVMCFEVCRGEAAMYWRYAQPRALERIRLMPIPFAFANESEADRAVTTSVVVCKLQHFDASSNRFVDSLCFTLSDGEPFDTGPLNAPVRARRSCSRNAEESQESDHVEAMLWRILMRTDDVGAVTALAAAARIDSQVVCSEASSVDARVPFIGLSWCDTVVPSCEQLLRNVPCIAPFTLLDPASTLLAADDCESDAATSCSLMRRPFQWSETLAKVCINELRVRASILSDVTHVNASFSLRVDVLDCCTLYQRSVLDQLAVSSDLSVRYSHPKTASGPTPPAHSSLVDSVTCDTTVHSAGVTLEQPSIATLLYCADRMRDAFSDGQSRQISEVDSPAFAQALVVCNDTGETIEVETLGASTSVNCSNEFERGDNGSMYRLGNGQATLVFPCFAASRLRVRLAFRVPSISQYGRTAPIVVQRQLDSDACSCLKTCLISDSDGLPIAIHVLVRHASASATSPQPFCQVIVRGSLQLVSLLQELDVQAMLRFAPQAMADGEARRAGRSCTIRPALLDLLLQPINMTRGRHTPSLLVSARQVQSVQLRALANPEAPWSRVIYFAAAEGDVNCSHSLFRLHTSQVDSVVVWSTVLHDAQLGHVLVLSPLFLLNNQLPQDLLASLAVYRSLSQSYALDADVTQLSVAPGGCDSLLRFSASPDLFPPGCEVEPQGKAAIEAAQLVTDRPLIGLRLGLQHSRLSRPPLILNTRVLFCKFVHAQPRSLDLFTLVYRSARLLDPPTTPVPLAFESDSLDLGDDKRPRLRAELCKAYQAVPTVQINVLTAAPDVPPALIPAVDASVAVPHETALQQSNGPAAFSQAAHHQEKSASACGDESAAKSAGQAQEADSHAASQNNKLPTNTGIFSQLLSLLGKPAAATAGDDADASHVTESYGDVSPQLHWRVAVRHFELIVCDPLTTATNTLDATPLLGIRLGGLEAEARVGVSPSGEKRTKLDCRVKALEVANLAFHYQDHTASDPGVFHYPTVLALNARRADDAELTVHCVLEHAAAQYKLRKLAISCPALLELLLEDTFIQRLVSLAPAFFGVIMRGPADAPTTAPTAADLQSEDSLRELRVDALTLCLTLKCSPPTIPLCVSLSRSMIRLEPLVVRRQSAADANNVPIVQEVLRHYLRNALFKSGRVIGSLELLGNPSAFLAEMSAGVADLVRLPAAHAQRYGMRYALSGLYSGFESLGAHLLRGSLSTVRALASSVAQNLDRLSCDADHVVRQERARTASPESALDGLFGGLTGLGLSLLGAVAGLADHPLRSVARTDDRLGTPNGHRSMLWQLLFELNRGIVGLLTKPLSGVAELIAQTSQGILHSTGLETARECSFDAAYVRALFDQPHSVLAPRVTALQFRLLLHADPRYAAAGALIAAPYRLLPACRLLHTQETCDLLVSAHWLLLVHRTRQPLRSAPHTPSDVRADWTVQILYAFERASITRFQYDPLARLLTIPVPARLGTHTCDSEPEPESDSHNQCEWQSCLQDTDGNRLVCLLVDPDEVHNAAEFLAMLAVWP